MTAKSARPVRGDEVEPRYLRVLQVAAQVGVSAATVRRAIQSGDLEGYRVGDTWVIPVDAVDHWVRGSQPTAA